MGTFTAAAIQSAFVNIAEDLHVSVQRASYLTSLVIAILGGAPIFWRPLAHAYGRRPIFLISLVGSLVGNIGCVFCHSYATMGLCRAITAFFISPAASLGSAVVSETFFRQERARYMGIWTAMVTIGVPLAPLIFGFVALRVGYRWIYWTLAIVSSSVVPRLRTGLTSHSSDQRRTVHTLLLFRPRDAIRPCHGGNRGAAVVAIVVVEEGASQFPPNRSHSYFAARLRTPLFARQAPLCCYSRSCIRNGLSLG